MQSPPLHESPEDAARPLARDRARRFERRAVLRLWAAALAGASGLRTGGGLAAPDPVTAQELPAVDAEPAPGASPGVESEPDVEPGPTPTPSVVPDERTTTLTIDTETAFLRPRFDPDAGMFAIASLLGPGAAWIPENAPPRGALWLNGVRTDGGPPIGIDGGGGLDLISRSPTELRLVHRATELRVTLEYAVAPGNAITHRLSLLNGRADGDITIASAATLSLPLWSGEFTEVLAADDAPQGWGLLRHTLPVSYGNHELRNARDGIYPIVRLANWDGSGIIVAVNTATAWRVEVTVEGEQRVLRAGEYQSDLTLEPGDRVRLPDVVTILYSGGSDGATAALHRYLEAVSLPPPRGWERTPPAVFNTWFGHGIDLRDNGRQDSALRQSARVAANAGLEVFVVDAGWYLGCPEPEVAGDRGQAVNRLPPPQVVAAVDLSAPDEDDAAPAAPVVVANAVTAGDFHLGLGTWTENPDKWEAERGDGGSRADGLRNFSDYVHGLDVRRPDGSVAGKMRFGLWVEPERIDLDYNRRKQIRRWVIPGTPILDFTRTEVVDGLAERLQQAIDAYRVDYLKVDANYDVPPDVGRRRTGHFFTRWSQGFEQLLEALRRNNPSLYIEHCAGGLKRYWLGLAHLAHGNWLDDDVTAQNVGGLLDAADALMLPRQKTVFVTEPTEALWDLPAVVRAYWGNEHRNGGAIGFSNRLEKWGPDQLDAARGVLEQWKREVRNQA